MVDLLNIVKWVAIIGVAVLLIGAITQGLALLDDLDTGFAGTVGAEGAGGLHEETTGAEYLVQFGEALGVDGGLFVWLGAVSTFVVTVVLVWVVVRWVIKVFG